MTTRSEGVYHCIARLTLVARHCSVLERGMISLLLALLAGEIGFGGLLPSARIISYLLLAFCGVSLLFSLFEAAEE